MHVISFCVYENDWQRDDSRKKKQIWHTREKEMKTRIDLNPKWNDLKMIKLKFRFLLSKLLPKHTQTFSAFVVWFNCWFSQICFQTISLPPIKMLIKRTVTTGYCWEKDKKNTFFRWHENSVGRWIEQINSVKMVSFVIVFTWNRIRNSSRFRYVSVDILS